MAETPSRTKKTNNKKIKILFEILFFATLTILGLYYVLKDDPRVIFSYLQSTKFFPLSLALILAFSTILIDGLSLTMITRTFNREYKYHQGVINSAIGGFIGCYIKTGSTVLQAYTFNKQNVKPTQAASILTMNFLSYQLSLCLYSTVVFAVGYPLLSGIPLSFLGGMKLLWICLFGLGYQLLFLLLIIVLGLSKTLHRFFINDILGFLGRIHLINDPEKVQKRWTVKVVTFRIEMKRLMANKKVFISSILLNLLKMFILGCIPFITFWSLGITGNQLDFFQSLLGSGYVTLIQSILTVGAPEVVFQSIFVALLNQVENAASIASAGNLMWRFISFYFIFAIGALTFLLYRGNKNQRPALLSNTATLYDLEAISLSEIKDDRVKEFLSAVQNTTNQKTHRKTPIFTKEDIKLSFERISDDLNRESYKPKPEITDDQFNIILSEGKRDLAKALEESEKIQSQQEDPEIIKETNREIQVTEKKNLKIQHRKMLKRQKRLEKTLQKQRRKMEKLQPKGSKVSFDNNYIRIESPEIEESVVNPSGENKESNQDSL